ncbi:MAG: hypothetical protein Q9217_001882 [Psora testacea]
MTPLLHLPQELRDEIWALVTLHTDAPGTHQSPACSEQSHTYLHLLRTCRQINKELTPYLYNKVCLSVLHPNQALQWIAHIGPTNSSYIRHLTLKFTSLLLEHTEDRYMEDRKALWNLALQSMPNLCSLDFHFEQDGHVSSFSAPFDKDLNASDSELLTTLMASALSYTRTLPPAPHPTEAARWAYLPHLRHRPIHHAIISISEPMPPILIQYFNQVLLLKSANGRNGGVSSLTSSLRSESMDHSITGLPPSFFQGNGFYLHRTSTFNEDNENASALLTYRRLPRTNESPAPMLEAMFKDLRGLQYLRLGCSHLNSDFLTYVPKRLHTLDVAFTDDDPIRVADNLMIMRSICKKLFTLAIAVSPLHDRDHVGEDERHEVFFDRRFVSKEIEELWQPFWKALDEVKESRVKVWEGEGPGFKRGKGS